MKQVHRDVAFFEERRLHDVLIRQAQAPPQSFLMPAGDLQEIWDQRLLELLDKRRHDLQVCMVFSHCYARNPLRLANTQLSLSSTRKTKRFTMCSRGGGGGVSISINIFANK